MIDEHRPEKEWPEAGVLTFNKYETKYRPELEPVLRGVTCHIKSGEKVQVISNNFSSDVRFLTDY